MAEKDGDLSTASVALKIFEHIWSWSGANDVWRWILMVAIAVIAAAAAFILAAKALTKLFEVLCKLFELYKASGIPLFLSPQDRLRVRRRAQFCAVLEADLAYIAKAESWNDQYFTDLEAEVETEGGYYLTQFHRFIGNKSHGLRKERSLIRAISSSSERAIQLTGEPGAGKSVALRHLASQLAARGKKAKDKTALVPLYVNLREITLPDGITVTSDVIKNFILDNIRRGDSDTTEFVRENWSDYREKGIWFFLFDSFDEIPAVLHAEKGSPATGQYSRAIREFLEGMGSCKGVLASREFKGPEALPWKRFRILGLTSEKQHELVSNAYLTPEQSTTVLHHLASKDGSLGNTPLFLTLLCKYVKEENRAPKNDYQLLSLQIDRLARKDFDYLKRTYGLSSADLVQGSRRIARLFAEESTLGLSPTIDKVAAILDEREIPGGSIQKFIAAMVDSKIARADVPNAAPGDRRFAFAHRRYQEALFVQHLVENVGYISGAELLTDPRWREYAVTLLETQPMEVISGMVQSATELLRVEAHRQRRIRANVPLNNEFGYFDWRNETTTVLRLLQSGLARRVEEIPSELSRAAADYLRPRWDFGDSNDRANVIRLAGLLPQNVLAQYLSETFSRGTRRAEYYAFNQTTALRGSTPLTVKAAVLKKLSFQILGAGDRAGELRLEALAARLPQDIGADYVLRRCLFLRRVTAVVGNLPGFIFPQWPLTALYRALNVQNREWTSSGNARTRAAVAMFSMMFLYGGIWAVQLMTARDAQISHQQGFALGQQVSEFISAGGFNPKLILLTFLITCVLCSIFPALYLFRAKGEPINFGFVASRLRRAEVWTRYSRPFFVVGSIALAFTMLVYVTGRFVVWASDFFFKVRTESSPFAVGLTIYVVLAMILAAFATFMVRREISKDKAEFRVALESARGNECRACLGAKNATQLLTWMGLFELASGANEKSVRASPLNWLRSLSSVLQDVLRNPSRVGDFKKFLSGNDDIIVLKDCLDLIDSYIAAIHLWEANAEKKIAPGANTALSGSSA